MAVNISIRIEELKYVPYDLAFAAFTISGDIGDNIFAGYGKTPYEALHDLIKELTIAEIWRAENE